MFASNLKRLLVLHLRDRDVSDEGQADIAAGFELLRGSYLVSVGRESRDRYLTTTQIGGVLLGRSERVASYRDAAVTKGCVGGAARHLKR